MIDEQDQKPQQKGNTGFLRVVKAAGYSTQGLKAAWQHESAFRQELSSGIVLVPLAYWLAETWMQLLFMMAACMLVLITELLNSAIETVVDRISVEQHTLAGRAKDIASAAVALAIVLVVISYVSVALERFAPLSPAGSP
jgi:diacylglycerol kinase (ATP)